jgi:hypothetical protein
MSAPIAAPRAPWPSPARSIRLARPAGFDKDGLPGAAGNISGAPRRFSKGRKLAGRGSRGFRFIKPAAFGFAPPHFLTASVFAKDR